MNGLGIWISLGSFISAYKGVKFKVKKIGLSVATPPTDQLTTDYN